MMLLSAGLASCSQDDMPQAGGTPLPDGEYPLTLTARVDGMNTRATGKDAWVDGDKIGVRIGTDDATGCYKLNSDGSMKNVITSVYWQSIAPATVTAWYPYTPQDGVNISNQKDGFADFDFLTATATDQSYKSPVSLKFKHQMAKVSYTLQAGDGITEDDLKGAAVQIAGCTKASFSEGELTGADDGWITPASDKDALLVPQNMTNRPFIKVSINGNDFIYTPGEGAANLQSGTHYIYTITVKADSIEVTAVTGGSWTDGGSEDVGITITYDGTETEAKTGDYYYADGTWSDGGLRKLYADGTMKWAETMPQPVSGKTCIGIVFHVGQHESDKSDYSGTGIGEAKCHGYVVALENATSGYCMWGVYEKELGCCPTDADGNKLNNYSNPDIDWNGYAWTQKIITAAGGKDKLNATESAGYPATWYAVVSYETGCNAPSNSSGWFLPSIGQMWNIYKNRSTLFASKSVATDLKTDKYWSSSEHYSRPAEGALCVRVGSDYVTAEYKSYGSSCTVRAILAF